jgi:hypothetical protein
MTASSRRVLFGFSIFNYFREMWPVAEHYARRGYEVHALIGWTGANADDARARCDAAGFRLHEVPEILRYGYTHPVGLIRKHRELKRWSDTLVGSARPAAVFVGHFHSCGALDNGIAWASRKRHLPLCGLPVSIYLGERQVVTARFNNVKLGMVSTALAVDHSARNRWIARVFPRWTREQGGRRLFMFPPEHLLLSWLFGLLPPNVWQKPSELLDLVFVEAEASRRMLEESGYDLGKVVVCGKPLADRVFERLSDPDHRAALYRYLRLEPDQPFVLVNVEPSAEHHYSSWDDHWRRFEGLMSCLKATRLPIVLSLHPLCEPARYRYVEERYGFRVSEDYKIIELYPYAGLSVSFPCSTNALALTFERPLVIYDFFGLTRDEYPTHDLYRTPGAAIAYDLDALADHLGHARAKMSPPFSGAALQSASAVVEQTLHARFAV